MNDSNDQIVDVGGAPPLRMYWIPNPPRHPFRQQVFSVEEARLNLDLLAKYDLYLGDSVINANVGGLEYYNHVTGEWEEWEDATGRDVWEAFPGAGKVDPNSQLV